MKTISNLNEIPEVKSYLDRIGAEPRSLLKAVVREMAGKYWRDIAVIKFERNGSVAAPDEFAPLDVEIAKIKEAFSQYDIPHPKPVAKMTNLPKAIQDAGQENVFKFYNTSGEIVMVQVRRDIADGNKAYVPYTFWSDGKWRSAEPEEKLPLWGIDRIGNNTTVFIHEGAKAARAMSDMIEARTVQAKEKLKTHPWGSDMTNAAHLGWIGGALSPLRTDWSILKKLGVQRAYIVSDNDAPGNGAVAQISRLLRIPTFHVQFTDMFPASFDLADEFPKEMFSDIDGMKHYIGPSFRECLHPATWATDTIQTSKGRTSYVIRETFAQMWTYIEEADVFVCTEMPEIIRTEAVANKMFAAFSDAQNTTQYLLKKYKGRVVKLCYRPGEPSGVLEYGGTSALNLHVPGNIKPKAGDAGPWEEFLEYMFPDPKERDDVKRWCATLISKPGVRMQFGLLLVSEAQGIGKTTLGAEVLGKLVGPLNVGYPTERTIVDSGFNDWIAQKRLVVVNEIYSGHSWKAYNTLKTYITDKDVEVNVKYQRPYKIENWAHIVACSNSPRALKMEQDDRRWFYPKLPQKPWKPEKFADFYRWLQSGGLSIIYQWAIDYGAYISPNERAPMTSMKKELIFESRSEAQQEAAALSEAAMTMPEPVALVTKGIEGWIKSQIQGPLFDSNHEIRKSMREMGMVQLDQRYFINKRTQYVLVNDSGNRKLLEITDEKERRKALGEMVKAPSEVMEPSM